ncbi:hypothetical protein BT96DRAFT_988508 [Gymnopus androsaceus JB14]|uniref:Uncharacterized protein n=1 Tax=Gymnopus androsaceus JB14 TaxID=1447944 RepID=A0A6A4I6F2_9AGAR|nr:hypothetical protein BT96DRAFT_988508 [Gymnopus androsaceus JB14]
MVQARIQAENFFKWLEEEGDCLQSLMCTPSSKTLEMEYFLKLESFHYEDQQKLIADVQALEQKLGVSACWKEISPEWEAAKKPVKEWDYRKASDKLEGLLVACIFEMTHLNVAGTGYKMHKHLANALKTCSKSIQATINAYNMAAHTHSAGSIIK